MSAKIQKNIRIEHSTNDLLSSISDITKISDGEIINGLIRNYAIDIGILSEEKNSALVSHILSDDNTGAISTVTNTLTEFKNSLAYLKYICDCIQSSVRESEKNSYVNTDMMNVLLKFLSVSEGRDGITTLPSFDEKINPANKNNQHPLLSQSLENFEEKIKRTQRANAPNQV